MKKPAAQFPEEHEYKVALVLSKPRDFMVAALALTCFINTQVFAQESDGVQGEVGTEVDSQQGAGVGGRLPGTLGQGSGPVGRTPITQGMDTGGGDVFSAWLGHTITRDSNLFRRADAENPQSDTINSTSVSFRVNKPISQQRFNFEVSEIINRYNNNSQLNFNATNYRGGWTWMPSERWTIGANASRIKSLSPFEDTLGGGTTTQRNVSTLESKGISVDGWITGGWYLVAGASQDDTKSEQGIINQPDQRTKNVNAGLRYVTPLGNSITLMRRTANGDYLDQSATATTGTSFKETESSLQAIWNASEKSQFQGRVGRIERNNDQLSQRDFSGTSVDAGYTWRPTSILSFNVTAGRRNSPLNDPSFSYSRDDTYTFTPAWRVTEKVSTHLTLARAESQYRGSGPVVPTGPGREDTTNSAEIGLDWEAMRSLTVNTSLQRARRTSNQPLVEYDDNIARVGVMWMFW